MEKVRNHMFLFALLTILLLALTFIFFAYAKIHFKIKLTIIENQLELELIYKFLWKESKTEYRFSLESLLNFLDFIDMENIDSYKRGDLKHKILEYFSRTEDMRLIIRFLKHAKLKELVWITYIGLASADQTGYITGILWGLKGISLSLLKKARHFNFQINIYPDFSNTRLNSDLTCILKIRNAHIIFISMALLLAKVRGEYYGIGSEAAG